MAENELVGEVPAIPAAEAPPGPPGEENPPEAPPAVDDTPDPATLQAEIKALEEKRKKAEEDARYWRRQKAEARKDYFKPEQPQPAATAEQGLKKPDPEQFDDYNEYVDALTDYKVDLKRQEWEREQTQKAQDANSQQRMTQLHERINEGYAKYEDFEDVAMDPTVPITPMVMDVLSETDAPADIAYYLGKNRPEAVKISRMTPTAAAREIAKIEAKLDGKPPEPPPGKKTTAAPPPINPVGSNAPAGGKSLEDMTQREYEEYRNKQGARRF